MINESSTLKLEVTLDQIIGTKLVYISSDGGLSYMCMSSSSLVVLNNI